MMGWVLPDPLVHSEVLYDCTQAPFCAWALSKPLTFMFSITCMHTHTCLTHICQYSIWPFDLSWSHSISLSLSLDWGLLTCRCQCDCLQRGGKAWPFLSYSLSVPPCSLCFTLAISRSTEGCRGKLPDKGGKHSAHVSKLW